MKPENEFSQARSKTEKGTEEMPSELSSETVSPLDPRAEAFKEYETRKSRVADGADEQKGLASWCDAHGVWDGAKRHWEALLRLDPNNEAARKRLGFRLRARVWVFDSPSAEKVAQDKAAKYWKGVLGIYHKQMHVRSRGAATTHAQALARVEAIGDAKAAGTIWQEFAADWHHHSLIVQPLARFKTAEASGMLAALAVYSLDKKAQKSAVEALRDRPATEFGERLVSLMRPTLKYEIRPVGMPSAIPARRLFVQDEDANYEFLFSQGEALATESLASCYVPRLSAEERRMAEQFDEDQTRMARESLELQVDLAKRRIDDFNRSVRALNVRVADVLNSSCSAGIEAEPASGRRWLAQTLGTTYEPPINAPKPTFSEIVEPLYRPTFLPIPVAT